MDFPSELRHLERLYGNSLHKIFLPELIFGDMRGNRLASSRKTGGFEG